MKRSYALAMLGVSAASALAPLRISAQTAAIRTGLGATDSAILIPVAQTFGYLERAGLSVDTQYIANGAATISAMLGGAIDAGASNSLSFLQARDKGLPLKIIAAQAIYREGAASTALVVAKASALRTARDLAGKTIGINALGGSPHIAVQAWIDKNGGDAKSTHYVEFPFPAMPAALAAGRVDAIMVAEPALSTALENGRIFADAYGAIGKLWISDAVIATESWIDAHADEVKRFAQALRAAGAWANRNHDKTAELAAKVLKIEPAVVRTMRRAVFAEQVTPKMMQPVIDAGVAYGALSKALVAEDVFSRFAL